MCKKIIVAVGIVLSLSISLATIKDGTAWDNNENKSFSKVKVAMLYENITDGIQIGRSMEETIWIFKETGTNLIFRGFWKWSPVVESPKEIPAELFELAADRAVNSEQTREGLRKTGHYYKELERWISAIKKEVPDITFVGAIPAQTLGRIEFNPITGKVYSTEETWNMALDPVKWKIEKEGKPVTKEKFQSWFQGVHPYGGKSEINYDWRKAPAYFPDITNREFQELMLSWAKRQINAGADAIWIDMLYHQAYRLAQITRNVTHPAVKESIEAAAKIVGEIHNYGGSKGKYVYVGSWDGAFVWAELAGRRFPYSPPNIDFITVSPSKNEVLNKKLDASSWKKRIEITKRVYPDIPIFAFIDWSFDDSQTVAFSQRLNRQEQCEVLRSFDESFGKLGIKFIYPIHGGYMGRGEATKKLAFGKFRTYDSLAPEFDTYGTIKELAQEKAKNKNISEVSDSLQ